MSVLNLLDCFVCCVISYCFVCILLCYRFGQVSVAKVVSPDEGYIMLIRLCYLFSHHSHPAPSLGLHSSRAPPERWLILPGEPPLQPVPLAVVEAPCVCWPLGARAAFLVRTGEATPRCWSRFWTSPSWWWWRSPRREE